MPSLIRTLLSLLILTLTILSFIFTVLTLLTPSLATSASYADPSNPSAPSIDTRVYIGTLTRGPYRSTYAFTKNDTTGTYASQTSRGQICLASDAEYLCQQMHIGTKALIAGSALTGAGMLGALLLLATAFSSSSTSASPSTSASSISTGDNIAHAVRTWMTVTLTTGVLATALGSLLLLNLLVTQQWPAGDYITTGPVYVLQDHWLVSKGAVWSLLASLPSVVGLCLMVGLGETQLVAQQQQHRHRGHGGYGGRDGYGEGWEQGEKQVQEQGQGAGYGQGEARVYVEEPSGRFRGGTTYV